MEVKRKRAGKHECSFQNRWKPATCNRRRILGIR